MSKCGLVEAILLKGRALGTICLLAVSALD